MWDVFLVLDEEGHMGATDSHRRAGGDSPFSTTEHMHVKVQSLLKE